MYAADDLDTALAEVFQSGRVIATAAPNGQYLTVWAATRVLRLLDVRGTWPIRQVASHPHQYGSKAGVPTLGTRHRCAPQGR